jgi:hypothetical protein
VVWFSAIDAILFYVMSYCNNLMAWSTWHKCTISIFANDNGYM